MATSKTEAKPDSDAPVEGAGSGASKRKKTLVLVLALLVLLVAGGGAWLLWSRHKAQQALDEGEEEVSQAAEHKDKADPKKPPAYLSLDNMVVNLADPGGERVAQIGVMLELSDEKSSDKVRPYLPSIRNDVLLLMSQKKADELLGREGKEQLATEILAAAAGYFEGADKGKKGKDQAENPVRRVLFSSLIIQ